MKLNPRVKKVLPEKDFQLSLTFSNGEKRVYNAKPLLQQGGVFAELKSETAFRSAHVRHGTVQWAGGQDLCPDSLYELSVPAARLLVVREKKSAYRIKPARKHRR